MEEILLVEDEVLIARTVKSYLEMAGFKVIHFERGREALDFLRKNTPHLAIVDLMLPDISGESICSELKRNMDIPLIILTAKSSEEERITGFQIGADDYVVKPFSPGELVYRVKAVLRRYRKEDNMKNNILSFNNGSLIIDPIKYEVILNGKKIKITPSEFRILHTIASKPQKIFTREEIVEKALDYHFEGYERSIDAHIKNLRQKLNDDPRSPSYIMTVYGVGYRFVATQDKT